MDVLSLPGHAKCGTCGRYTARPVDGQCMVAYLHGPAKVQTGPGNSREGSGMAKRCPVCKENGGCFISSCPCSCHKEAAFQARGLNPELAWKVRAPMSVLTMRNSFRARLADRAY